MTPRLRFGSHRFLWGALQFAVLAGAALATSAMAQVQATPPISAPGVSESVAAVDDDTTREEAQYTGRPATYGATLNYRFR